VGPESVGPGRSAMFEAVEDGYAGVPGPRSLGFSNPGAYGYSQTSIWTGRGWASFRESYLAEARLLRSTLLGSFVNRGYVKLLALEATSPPNP